ncbi:hypothetical protein [Micromonospora sp. NBC_01739]|uniref:hypothetical protein n=1 Tax=Micromonospora sp. NBC_01739 TaxID=2975985 RepID=UPI002E10C0E9|nr:hypothetical protein OIE53_19625 [Micromonospora sp. NBC_01739]
MTEPLNDPAEPAHRSLADRATQALLALADQADRKKTEAERNAISTACNRAEAVTARLTTCRDIDAELAVRGVAHIRPSVPAQVARSITNLRRVATQATAPSQDLTERLRAGAVQDSLSSAETIAKNLEQSLQKAGNAEQKRLRPEGLDQPIAVMPGSESLQVRISRIRAAWSRPFTGPIEQLPTAVDGWRQHAADWEDIQHELTRRLASLPPEIKTFIEAAASDAGAPWSLVTAAVREWLDTDGRGDGYGVRKW